MSDIISIVGKDLKNLNNVLYAYENELAEYYNHLAITGKTLGQALKEQATYSALYGEKGIELSVLLKYIDSLIKQTRSKLIRRYNENYNPALSERMVEKYVDGEQEYIDLYSKWLEVKELCDKHELIVDAFNRRGFALRDLTTSYVNEIQGVTL